MADIHNNIKDHTENKDDGDNGGNKNGNADGTTADDNQEEMTAEEKELAELEAAMAM